MSRNQWVIVGGALVVILAIAVYFFYFANSDAGDATAATQSGGFTITASDHVMGPANAKVTLIEYAAPTCPHCSRYSQEVIPLLIKQYVDTGKVRYVFRVFPLSSLDGAVEGMAHCLSVNNSQAYFGFIDLMFRNQKQWDQPEYPESVPDAHAGLLKMANIAGLSPERANSCMTDKGNADHVNQVAQDAMTRYGVNGTPTLVINGAVQPPGEVPWDQLKSTLDKDLSKK